MGKIVAISGGDLKSTNSLNLFAIQLTEKETKLIILTNDNTLTFDDVSKSLYSSNSKDSARIEFYLLE